MGYNPNLGYLLIERQHDRDLVVVYPDREKALKALDSNDPLIDGFVEKDCLDAWILGERDGDFILGREIVLTEGVEIEDLGTPDENP